MLTDPPRRGSAGCPHTAPGSLVAGQARHSDHGEPSRMPHPPPSSPASPGTARLLSPSSLGGPSPRKTPPLRPPVSRPFCGLSAHPPEVCGAKSLTPRLPRDLGTGPRPVLRHPCLGDQAPCILPCHTPEGIGGIPLSGHPMPPPKAWLGLCTLGSSSCTAPCSVGFLGLSLHPSNLPSSVPAQCWGLGAPQGREHPQW